VVIFELRLVKLLSENNQRFRSAKVKVIQCNWKRTLEKKWKVDELE